MSKPLFSPPPGFDELTVDEQIAYVQALWDRIAATSEKVPVPAWHQEIIRKRLAELEADRDSAVPWDQAKEQILGLLDKK